MTTSDILRIELSQLLRGGGAHMALDEAVADFPAGAINAHPPNVPYTAWQLLEHVRIAQHDILEYVTNRSYLAPAWPEDYWPPADAVASPDEFATTIEGFKADRQALLDLVEVPGTDLLAAIPGTPGHTLVREILLVADHNAYHVGEFASLRQVMGTWPAGRRP